MRLGRRHFLRTVGVTALAGASGLLAACQAPSAAPTTGGAPPAAATAAGLAPTSPPSAPPTSVPTAPPTSAPTAPPTSAPAATATRAPTGLAASAAAGKPMYQQDAQHTGRSPYAGPRQPGLARRFDTALPANLPPDALIPRADFQSSSAIGPDGTIYIANFAGVLYALRDSPSTSDALEVAWRFHPPAASSFHATPALSADGSTVYLGFATGAFQSSGKATLYALKAPRDGGGQAAIAWTVDLGAARVMASPTVGPDGTIYIATSTGQLFAIAGDGSTRWTTRTGPTIKSAPALAADGTLYHATSDGKMYALSPQGQVSWTFDFGEHLGPTPLVVSDSSGPAGGAGGASGVGSGASPAVGPDGTVYIGANNSNLYAVTPDGQLKWLFEAERELAGIWTTPVLSADGGTLYFGANKGGVYALNAASGAKRWQFSVYGSIYASSVLDARGVLYTGTTIEHVYAVNATTGEPVWDYDAHNQVWSAPSIRPDGSLVIADRSGLIQVLA